MRTFLFQLLQFALGPEHSVGSDQFVYWNAADTRKKLSPDAFVRLGVPQTAFGSWKTWEQGGAPELAVEIISPNEGDGATWDEKFSRYYEVGVKELVRFDPEEPEGRRLRAWDRVEGDLVERVIAEDRTPCLTLGLAWTVRKDSRQPGRGRGPAARRRRRAAARDARGEGRAAQAGGVGGARGGGARTRSCGGAGPRA